MQIDEFFASLKSDPPRTDTDMQARLALIEDEDDRLNASDYAGEFMAARGQAAEA